MTWWRIIVLVFALNRANFANAVRGSQPLWNETYTDRLKKDLLLNYDKFARPSQHYNLTTVKIGLAIIHIESDEFKSTLLVHSWLKLVWNDDKLKWNSSAYGGISHIKVAPHEIWSPDILLYNSASGNIMSTYGSTYSLLYANGEVLWVPPSYFTAFCNFDLRYWPFDTQHCFLKFGSWTHHGYEMNVTLMERPIEMELAVVSTEWTITETSSERQEKTYSCCEEPYPSVNFNLTLVRNSPSYKAVIITPCFAVIFLTLASFVLPVNSGEKLLLNICAALIVCMFMLYFTQKIPSIGSHVPLIVSFYSASLYIVTLSAVSSVVVLWMVRSNHSKPPPAKIIRVLNGKLGKMLCLAPQVSQEKIRIQNESSEALRISDAQVETTNFPVRNDWEIVAKALNRLCLIVHGFIFLLMSVIFCI